MNGLVALGGSAARAIGPIFAGVLVTFCFSSTFIEPHIGACILFAVIAVLGAIVASLTFFILHDEDEDV